MPYGFIGTTSHNYLSAITEALDIANSVHLRVPSHARNSGSIDSIPYPSDTAFGGGHTTSPSTQDNIVHQPVTGFELIQRLQLLNTRLAEDIHHVCTKLEELCETVYIIPDTQSKFLDITIRLKSLLPEFESLADESRILLHRFTTELLDLDASPLF
ncbi:MAG: hypothetical protein LBC96_09740 [Lachnospiraceae bacterium]|jgi:hypothetical protein|nr:hypothetical protein [Lachnospiraceae bacterium]